jgi:hypothetical protein
MSDTDMTPPGEFGDADPEDAWDEEDFFEQKIEVLAQFIDDLRVKRDARFDARLAEARRLAQKLDDLKNLLTERLQSLREDLEAL